MLATLDPAATAGALARLEDAGIVAVPIGAVEDRSAGVTLSSHGQTEPLPVFDRDELARFLESA